MPSGSVATALVLLAAGALFLWAGQLIWRAWRGAGPQSPGDEHGPAIAGETEVIVVLVHGTWAANASWTRPSSRLPSYLQRHLGFYPPKAKIAIQTCSWSGENSFVARDRGAQCLRKQLLSNYFAYPDTLQFVIAHSHGGNIALLAQEHLNINLAGTICLSTPVILVTGEYYRGVEEPEAPKEWMHSVSTFVFVTTTFLAYWPAAIAFWILLLWLGRMPYSDEQMYYSLRSPYFAKYDRKNILFIRSHGDEATFALTTVAFVSWLSERLMKWTISRTNGMVRFLLRLALSIVFAPVPLMLVLAARVVGPEAARNFPTRRVYLESTPPGSWTVYGLNPQEVDRRNPEQVTLHSRGYVSFDACSVITDFIKKRLLTSRRMRSKLTRRQLREGP